MFFSQKVLKFERCGDGKLLVFSNPAPDTWPPVCGGAGPPWRPDEPAGRVGRGQGAGPGLLPGEVTQLCPFFTCHPKINPSTGGQYIIQHCLKLSKTKFTIIFLFVCVSDDSIILCAGSPTVRAPAWSPYYATTPPSDAMVHCFAMVHGAFLHHVMAWCMVH